MCWYPDGDKIVRNEYNPATAYAFGKQTVAIGIERTICSYCQRICNHFYDSRIPNFLFKYQMSTLF